MNRIYKYIVYLFSFLAVFAMGSCEDVLEYNPGLIDGSTAYVQLTLSYDKETSIDLRSRAASDYNGGTPGNAIRNIDEVWMVIYDADKKLLAKMPIVGNGTEINTLGIEISNVVNKDDQDNREPAEKNPGNQYLQDNTAGKVTCDLKIPTGRYYIYAVANVEGFAALTEEDIASPELLKSIKCRWETIITDNSEMFGIFSANSSNRNQTDENTIAVTNRTVTLHAWVRRLASKVTVAFDGTDLYDNVQVYVYDISIKDIPQTCYLGYENHPGWLNSDGTPWTPGKQDIDGTLHKENSRSDRYNVLHENGEIITILDEFKDSDINNVNPQNYLHICNGAHRYLGKGDTGNAESILDDTHAYTARSLYFYENMQGTGKKKQQTHPDNPSEIWKPNPDENVPGSGWKDEKAYGTYIEVSGYYRCTTNNEHVSAGPIKYRFMLGQDTDMDYNAIRNTHYKLTLQLKGYGNDADWHIEYKEDPAIRIASPQYISYLYNKTMNATVRITGELDDSDVLHAVIIGTEVPGDKKLGFREEPSDEKSIQTYWRPWGDGKITQGSDKPEYPDPKKYKDPISSTYDFYYTGVVNSDGPWNSFLSLRTTQLIQLRGNDGTGKGEDIVASKAAAASKLYYNTNQIGWRSYKVTAGNHDNYTADPYYDKGISNPYSVKYTKIDPSTGKIKERVFTIPLHTRAKELYTRTGYTGNNPYTTFPRRQRVKFYVTDKNGVLRSDIEPVYLDIIQARRIVNPKGVWRREGNHEDFHVKLMWLKDIDHNNPESKFETFPSKGPWSAEIVSGSDNIVTLSSTPEGSGSGAPAQSHVSHIEGASEHKIDFKINFVGNKGCAIVRVRYHNYTCEHDIFCRMGYDDIDVTGDGYEWSSYNVYKFDSNGNAIVNTSPLMEGSLFRRDITKAILPKNNDIEGFKMGQNISKTNGGQLKIWDPTTNREATSTWKGIRNSNSYNAVWDINNPDYHIATETEFSKMVTDDNSSDFTKINIAKGYGVLYGDGATTTQETVDGAFGYDKTIDDSDITSPKGMRGVFVYNRTNMKQLFFPIGKSGFGHRKAAGVWRSTDAEGTLRYASRSHIWTNPLNNTSGENEKIGDLPLFYDVYRRNGAIYWVRTYSGNNRTMTAFDMNYHTLSFKTYTTDATAVNGGDAALIRLVKTNDNKKGNIPVP